MASQSDRWITTARLLRRAGFGTTGAQVDAVATKNWSTYVDAALRADPEADVGAKATPMPTLTAPHNPGKTASVAERKNFSLKRVDQMTELSRWWLRRMTAVREPIHEKLTLLWHSHFATSVEKVQFASYMAAQNRKLRRLSLGDFWTLAYAMLTDAALMDYLDANGTSAKAPNENLAREFMELFALGRGNGYTEQDVRHGARALTGWAILSYTGETMMLPRRHDHTLKTLFGVTKNFDAAGFCDAVLAQPKSSEFVAKRLWQQLASDSAPSDRALARLVNAYGRSRDLRSLTHAVLTDNEFVNGRAAIVNTPVEWLIGVVRTLRVPMKTAGQLDTMDATLRELGQRPFYPPNVGGWPHGRLWMSTASANIRMRVAGQLASAGDLSMVDAVTPGERIDAVGYLIGIGEWSDRTVAALKPLTRNPVQLVAAAVNTPEYLTS